MREIIENIAAWIVAVAFVAFLLFWGPMLTAFLLYLIFPYIVNEYTQLLIIGVASGIYIIFVFRVREYFRCEK